MALPDYSIGGVCEAILANLATVTGINDPQAKRTPTGYLDYLISDFSRQGAQIIPSDQGNGKTKKVRLKFIPRRGDSTLLTDKSQQSCDGAGCREPMFQEKEVVIDRYRGACLKFNDDDIRTLCESPGEFSRLGIMSELDAIARGINADLIALQAANFGLNVPQGDALVRPLDMLDAASGAIRVNAWTQLMEDYKLNQMSGVPAIIGSGNAGKVNTIRNVACCNDAGVDVSALTAAWGYGYFRDHQVEGILGANQVIVAAPGSAMFVPYLEYKGDRTVPNGLDMRTTLVDPFNNMMYDMKVLYDTCDEVWVVHIGIHYTLCFVPQEVYEVGDVLRPGASPHVNGTFRYAFNEA